MGISKIIFRIDYLPAFKVFDSPGLALKIMNQDGKYEWNGFSDDSSKRQVGSAKQSKEEGYSLNLNCSPICIDGTLINHKGIAFEHVDKNDDLIRLITITNSLRDEYEIFQLKRSGIRLFYFNDLKLGSEIVKERFAALIDKTLVKNIISDNSILDSDLVLEPYNVEGKNINLTSTNGSIGTGAVNGDIDIKATGTFDATANTDIYASGTLTGNINATGNTIDLTSDGDLNIDQISATAAVTLTSSNGNILDASVADTNPNVTGTAITLNAANGSIGNAEDFDINSNGTVNASSDGNINLQETSGTLTLGVISSANGSGFRSGSGAI